MGPPNIDQKMIQLPKFSEITQRISEFRERTDIQASTRDVEISEDLIEKELIQKSLPKNLFQTAGSPPKQMKTGNFSLFKPNTKAAKKTQVWK